MSNAIGNVLKAPGTTIGSTYTPTEILYSTAKLTQKGRTIKGGQAFVKGGTVMARETATKKWVRYVDGSSGGVEIAKGILRDDVDTTDGDVLGNIVISGIVRYSKLIGYDAAALADLNGRVDTDADYLSF